MAKQGVGRVGLNAEQRFDTSGIHELFHPQRPLVSSFTEVQTRLNDLPYGANVIVAILSYTGYNQEDSVILNKGAVDRGLFRSLCFRTFKDLARNAGSEQEVFAIPDAREVTGYKRANYAKLSSEDALPLLHQEIEQDDVLIGKVIQPTDASKAGDLDGSKRDRSTIYKNKEPARVDKIMATPTKDGATLVHIRTRSARVPVIGNKYSSRHGQKGVCGLVLPQEDMPFTADGISPDLIMNPHAIPSRMTVGQILETLLGKAAMLTGQIGDGTAFAHLNATLEEGESTDTTATTPPPLLAERIGDVLHAFGYNRHGNERLYNGMTGEMLEAEVFIGPCHYMALKHMVVDKVHARATGPRQILTRQPVDGRSRDGGLRVGEVRSDANQSYCRNQCCCPSCCP